mmetsp:Transcript_20686/g.73051  ORF Transcript_20686/g.73051 Transcript_20686/m.73051 type:complete len:589 (+) Transcript_20686:2875-4641(+)
MNGTGSVGGCGCAGITEPSRSWMNEVTSCCSPHSAKTSASGSRIWKRLDLMARIWTSDDLAVSARNCARRSNLTLVGSRRRRFLALRGERCGVTGLSKSRGEAAPALSRPAVMAAAAAAAATSASSLAFASLACTSLPLSSTRPAPVTVRNTCSRSVRPTCTSMMPAASAPAATALSVSASTVAAASSASLSPASPPVAAAAAASFASTSTASPACFGNTYSSTPMPRRSSFAPGATARISSTADSRWSTLPSLPSLPSLTSPSVGAGTVECACLHSSVRRKPVPYCRLSLTGAPMHWMRPRRMMATLSESTSASSILWVVRMMQRLRFSRSSRFHTWRRETGSMPVVGSSRYVMRGLAVSASATDRRRFMPPLNEPANASATCINSTSPSRSRTSCSTSAGGTPLRPANISMCSRAVSESQMTSCCGHTPSSLRMPLTSWPSDLPNTSASPSVLRSRPVSMLSVVVLPAPLCPRIVNICLSRTISHMLSTAVNAYLGFGTTLGPQSCLNDAYTLRRPLIISAGASPPVPFALARAAIAARCCRASNAGASPPSPPSSSPASAPGGMPPSTRMMKRVRRLSPWPSTRV